MIKVVNGLRKALQSFRASEIMVTYGLNLLKRAFKFRMHLKSYATRLPQANSQRCCPAQLRITQHHNIMLDIGLINHLTLQGSLCEITEAK